MVEAWVRKLERDLLANTPRLGALPARPTAGQSQPEQLRVASKTQSPAPSSTMPSGSLRTPSIRPRLEATGTASKWPLRPAALGVAKARQQHLAIEHHSRHWR
jgi:hypothetical protein